VVGTLSQSSYVSPVELPDGREGEKGWGMSPKSYDSKKAWFSIHHSILPVSYNKILEETPHFYCLRLNRISSSIEITDAGYDLLLLT
jgi:hypothetical protein